MAIQLLQHFVCMWRLARGIVEGAPPEMMPCLHGVPPLRQLLDFNNNDNDNSVFNNNNLKTKDP